jgi:hypothetical protein
MRTVDRGVMGVFHRLPRNQEVSSRPAQAIDGRRLMAEGVGFEQGQGIFSKSTTPQLPPHHQRRTAS